MANPSDGSESAMSAATDDNNAGQTSIQARSAELFHFADHSMSRQQAGEAVRVDLDTLTTLIGRDRSTAVSTMGHIAESQRAYAEALKGSNPLVSDRALTTAERQRDDIVRAQTEYRRTPEGIAAAPQADRLREAVAQAELEHDKLRAVRSYADIGPAAQRPKDTGAPDRAGTDPNSMRSAGDTTKTRRAIPPLEDRFNVFRIGLVEREYHFRDQAGKVAFTDKLLSISTACESPAAIKAMVDRAAERGWETVRLDGSPEFVRQGWIAAGLPRRG